MKLIDNLNVNKASGPDGIPNKILKLCAEELAPVLINIVQLNLTPDSSKHPENWKMANMIDLPLFKKGEKICPSKFPYSVTHYRLGIPTTYVINKSLYYISELN